MENLICAFLAVFAVCYFAFGFENIPWVVFWVAVPVITIAGVISSAVQKRVF